MFLVGPKLTQPMDPEIKSLNFIFPTKHVIPESLKFSHWLSEKNTSQVFFEMLQKKKATEKKTSGETKEGETHLGHKGPLPTQKKTQSFFGKKKTSKITKVFVSFQKF